MYENAKTTLFWLPFPRGFSWPPRTARLRRFQSVLERRLSALRVLRNSALQLRSRRLLRSLEWFNGGVFIGAGPWFHGPEHFYGHVDHHFDFREVIMGRFPPTGSIQRLIVRNFMGKRCMTRTAMKRHANVSNEASTLT